jgi:ferredoxin-nitrite reductase
MGADPQLAELHGTAVPLTALPEVLETLLVEHFGARRRSQTP